MNNISENSILETDYKKNGMLFICLMEQFNIYRKGYNNFSHSLGFIVGSGRE